MFEPAARARATASLPENGEGWPQHAGYLKQVVLSASLDRPDDEKWTRRAPVRCGLRAQIQPQISAVIARSAQRDEAISATRAGYASPVVAGADRSLREIETD